jgi:hypothetical protein
MHRIRARGEKKEGKALRAGRPLPCLLPNPYPVHPLHPC